MDHLGMFHEVARTLTTSLDLNQILGVIMDKMGLFFAPERWQLMLVDPVRKDLYYVIAAGEDPASLKGLRIPLGEGVAGWVASTGNPLVVPNLKADPHWSRFAKTNPDLDIQSIACVPIRSGNETLGVIQLLNSKFDLMSEYSISFLRLLCDYAAIAIGNSRSMTLIQELSITDDCTGLFNSRRLYAMLQEQVAVRLDGEPVPFSLIFIDLDHFKQVNDTHGHLVGTRLLSDVAGCLKQLSGPSNAAFRYGGDEFCLLLPGIEKEMSAALAQRFCVGLREHIFTPGKDLALRITGSFGVATYPEDGDSVHAILRSADAMMYEVKNTTRDDVAVMGHRRKSPGERFQLHGVRPAEVR